jgi:hypothetical protein
MNAQRLALLGIAGALAAGVAWQWPEIQRYLKVKRM